LADTILYVLSGGVLRRNMQWIPWQALLARQAWRLLAFPESLCAKVLKAKYLPEGKLLDRPPAGEASQTWRAIEHGLELLKQG
jgi:hypothetical protein